MVWNKKAPLSRFFLPLKDRQRTDFARASQRCKATAHDDQKKKDDREMEEVNVSKQTALILVLQKKCVYNLQVPLRTDRAKLQQPYTRASLFSLSLSLFPSSFKLFTTMSQTETVPTGDKTTTLTQVAPQEQKSGNKKSNVDFFLANDEGKHRLMNVLLQARNRLIPIMSNRRRQPRAVFAPVPGRAR